MDVLGPVAAAKARRKTSTHKNPYSNVPQSIGEAKGDMSFFCFGHLEKKHFVTFLETFLVTFLPVPFCLPFLAAGDPSKIDKSEFGSVAAKIHTARIWP